MLDGLEQVVEEASGDLMPKLDPFDRLAVIRDAQLEGHVALVREHAQALAAALDRPEDGSALGDAFLGQGPRWNERATSVLVVLLERSSPKPRLGYVLCALMNHYAHAFDVFQRAARSRFDASWPLGMRYGQDYALQYQLRTAAFDEPFPIVGYADDVGSHAEVVADLEDLGEITYPGPPYMWLNGERTARRFRVTGPRPEFGSDSVGEFCTEIVHFASAGRPVAIHRNDYVIK